MALTVTQNHPILVTGDTAASAAITTAKVYITGLYWFNPTTIGHKLALQDANGKELFEFICTVATQSQQYTFPDPIVANGLYSDYMDSGTLYVYVR